MSSEPAASAHRSDRYLRDPLADEDGGVPLAEAWADVAPRGRRTRPRDRPLNHEIADIETCHATRPVDVIQQGLSLIDHEEERPVIARCGELGIAAVIYDRSRAACSPVRSPVRRVTISGVPNGTTPGSTRACSRRPTRPEHRVRRSAPAAWRVVWVRRSRRRRSHGSSPAGRHVGDLRTSSVAHALDNAGASAVELGDADLAELDAAAAPLPPPCSRRSQRSCRVTTDVEAVADQISAAEEAVTPSTFRPIHVATVERHASTVLGLAGAREGRPDRGERAQGCRQSSKPLDF